MRQHLVLEALLAKMQQPAMIPRIPELVVALNDAVKTGLSLEVQAQLMVALPTIQGENLSFTNIEDRLWSDYTAGGAWIYQGDWATLPGYVQAWLDGSVDE
jgi:anionic cell wall polymer biosynthesis LytR-Cps2A-Psr (LCP) family protein